jgi:hypothetical protein
MQCQAQRTLSLLGATIDHETSYFFEQNLLVKHFYLILVNELSAYEFRTYGTRHGGSMLASTHLDVLLMLMFVITLHSLQ